MNARMKSLRSLLALALLTGLAAAPAAAQVPGISFNLAPRVGYFTPLGPMWEDAGDEVKLGSGLAVGVSAELGLLGIPFGLRANVDHVLNTSVEVGGTELTDEATMTVITGDLVFGGPRILPVRPYLLVGGGVKQYDLGAEELGEESDLALHVGAGVDLKFGPLGLVAEVSDYVSWFEAFDERKMQNDIFASIGIRVGMF